MLFSLIAALPRQDFFVLLSVIFVFILGDFLGTSMISLFRAHHSSLITHHSSLRLSLMLHCLTKTLLISLGSCLCILLTAGLLSAQTPTPQPSPAKPSPSRPSSAQLASLLQDPLLELAQLRRPPIPLAYDFTIDTCSSPSLPDLGSGPIAFPEKPMFRMEGRVMVNGGRVDIRKRVFAWRDGKWLPGNETRQLCDGTRFWNIERPPAPGLWCPTFVFDRDTSKTQVMNALANAGWAIEGRFSFFPHGDWLITALTTPPTQLWVGDDPVGQFPCRKVRSQLGGYQFTFWVDMKHEGLVRQVRIIIPGRPISRWKKLLPHRLAGAVEMTVLEVRDVEIDKIAGREMAVAGTFVTRAFFRDGKRECNMERIRRSNITLTPDLTAPGMTAPGAFVPGLPEGTVVDLANSSLKYLWRGGELTPFLDPAVAIGIGQSVRRIAREVRAAPAPLLRGFPLLSPDADSSPALAASSPPLLDKHCYEALGPRNGIYGLYAAFQLAGIGLKPEALFRPEYLGNEQEASSPLQLAAAANRNGLHATVAAGLTVRSLALSQWPILLRVKARPYSVEYNAWELYLGAREGQAWIWNPAHAPRLEPFGELAVRWDGSGLVLSRAPIGWLRLRSADIRFAALVGCLLVLVLWRVRRLARGRGTAQPAPGFFHYVRGSCLEGLAFVLITLAVALLWHALAGGGLLTRGGAVKNIRLSRLGHFLPEVGVDRVRRIAQGLESAILVDVRDPKSFYLERIPSARNIPLVASEEDFRAALARLPRDGRLVLYCARETCHMADKLASRLAAEGFTRLEIFKGGWEAWEKSENKKWPAS